MNVKQLILSVVSLFLTLTIHAQELTVKEMQATNDLSASQYRRNDLIGDPCALVKVQLATTGATFEGNVIQPVEYKAGEYWVYMSKGSKELMVKHPSFLPAHITFSDYNIGHGVQPLVTYRLTLVMPQIGNTNIDDGMRYLVMTVEPASAIVYIDNNLQTLQNGSLSILLPMGQHQYRVEAQAYDTKSGTFTIGNEKLSLPIKLESNMASLTINSATQGTQIFVNDQLRGTSSWSGMLPAGIYRLEGRLPGYRNHRQNITLAQREKQQVTIPALQAILGNLNVNYQPANAEVWIDGKKAGTSPDVFRNIIVGSHNIELRAAGYAPKQARITIEEGKTAMLSGSLERTANSQESHQTMSAQYHDTKPNYGLKDAYKDYFTIGSAINVRNISDEKQIALIKKEYNSVTPENDWKPGVIHPKEGVWNFERADIIANFCRKNGIKIRGHCLCSNYQFSDWMFNDEKGKPVNKKVYYERLRDHIHTVVNRYKDIVYCWDVVNEAIADKVSSSESSGSDDQSPYRQNKSFKLCGEEYIAKAFEFAREADPNALLFYNDNNYINNDKRQRIYNMVKKMKEAGVPIDGIGMQGHYTIDSPKEEELDQTISMFKQLVKHIHITELDLRINNTLGGQLASSRGEAKPMSAETVVLQNEQYARLFKVFRKHADVVDNVTFGNLSDKDSWLGVNNHPLPFDENYLPKACYSAIRDFDPALDSR